MRGRRPQPRFCHQPPGKGEVTPSSPRAASDHQPLAGLQGGHLPRPALLPAMFNNEPAPGHRKADGATHTVQLQPAQGYLDRRRLWRIANRQIGRRQCQSVHRTRARHAKPRQSGPPTVLHRHMWPGEGHGQPRRHGATRRNATRSPTSNRKGRAPWGSRITVGECPMIHQPVGIVSVVTMH